MSRSLIPAVLAFTVAAAVAMAGLPSASRERAARAERWRADLAVADDAVRRGETAVAERLYRQVLDETEATETGGLLQARAVDGLGDVRRLQGRNPEAIDLYQRSAKMWERLLGPSQPRLALTLHNLGAAQIYDRRYDDARATLERALVIWSVTTGDASPEAESTRRALAGAARPADER